MAKKVAVIGISSILLVAMVVAAVVAINHKSSSAPAGSSISTSTKAVQQICQPTDYRETCEKTLSAAAGNTTDPRQLIKTAFNVAVKHIGDAIKNSTFLKNAAKDHMVHDALENCKELLEFSINDLQISFDRLGAFDMSKIDEYMADLKTWLSGAITYQETCLDGFENTTGDTGEQMKKLLKLSGELTSNGLAMVTEFSKVLGSLGVNSPSRRLLAEDGFPTWMSEGRRRLLASATPNVVVAKDGSGKYKTIAEALREVPKKSNKTFVIYIKQGVYQEYVNITSQMWNVFLTGDGPKKTIITGNRSHRGGVNTFKSATLTVDGEHFTVKDMGIQNTAGSEGHQAVAIRVSSDRSVVYNCEITGYQDTLYAHAHRQFYRDCTISGTIDFIFGDAAAVFQNCTIVVRKPLEDQACMVTAQGRTGKRMTTGIVIQNCHITAEPEYMAVKQKFKSYLGRPWKNFSRTVIMQSQIDDIIDPTGWAPWNGNIHLDTLWYAEYNNRGPGSIKSQRVAWKGLQKTISPQAAESFTAAKFIDGNVWIPASGAPYEPGMGKVTV